MDPARRPGKNDRHGFTADPRTPDSCSRGAAADVEGGYGDTLYKLHRASVKTDLRTAKLLQHFEIEDVSDEEVDTVLDEE